MPNLSFLNHVHPFDIFFIVLALIFVILGIKRGFIGEVMRLTSVIAGFAVAIMYYKELQSKLTFMTLAESTKGAIAFLLIFVVTMIAVLIVGWIIQKAVHLTPLGVLDRIAGGLVGFVKLSFMAWIFVSSLESSPFKEAKVNLRASYTYSMLVTVPFKFKVPYLDLSPQSKRVTTTQKVYREATNTAKSLSKAKDATDSLRKHLKKSPDQ